MVYTNIIEGINTRALHSAKGWQAQIYSVRNRRNRPQPRSRLSDYYDVVPITLMSSENRIRIS